jgi:HAD superfamily hydrolase (TIGR01484 family)
MSTDAKLLLCTDLDRTLLPNGAQPESAPARERFRRLAERSEVTLAYVTGRHRALVEKAVLSYRIPQPQFVISDVGTRIYDLRRGRWTLLADWVDDIDRDFSGHDRREISGELADLSALRLQEPSRQNPHKISYYVPLHEDRAALCAEMERRLAGMGVRANLVWSVDEPNGVGLLDILPARAGKLEAIVQLSRGLGFGRDEVLFAGDSGNDLPVLVSDVPAVLVANAAEKVRAEAAALSAQRGTRERLYLARGGFWGMNGNYSAGVLEGLAHFHPELMRELAGEGAWQHVG